MTNPEFVKFVNQLAEKTGKKSLCEAVLKGYKICCEQTQLATEDELSDFPYEYFKGDDEILDDDNGLPQGTDYVFKPEIPDDEPMNFSSVPKTRPFDPRANTKLFRGGTWIAGGGIEKDRNASERAAAKLSGISMDDGELKPVEPVNVDEFENW